MPDKHAMLGGSNAHRYLVCTPSAALEATLPEETSPYAEEGTKAHSLAEVKLRRKLLKITGLKKPKDITPEMDEATDFYVDFVTEELNDAQKQTSDAALFVEQQVDFSDYVPEGFGTSDAVIVSDDLLEVIDLKYGKGVMVNAENNPQLMLYGLGAALRFKDIFNFKVVKVAIVQPRLEHVSVWTLPLDELMFWAEDYVTPRAQLAYKGEGEFVTGEHCRFCKAAGICRKRVDEAFNVIKHADGPTLTDEEIPAILGKLDAAEDWIKSIRAYAQDKAIREGVHWEGYKLVEARTLRKIEDQVAALKALEEAGFETEEVTTLKLNGISALEKTLGKKKFAEVLGSFVVKPKGEPVLVPESDKREAINIIDEMFKEETDEPK